MTLTGPVLRPSAKRRGSVIDFAGTTTTGSTPTTAVSAGSLVPGFSSYTIPFPIPSTYRFVDPVNGSDNTGDGSQGTPWKTWSKTRTTAPAGSTIVMQAGTFHEVPSTSVAFASVQAAPGAAVWFDGSSVVTGFQASGTAWVAPYNVTFTRAAATIGTWSSSSPEGIYRNYQDLLWLDGTPLVQIADGSTPGPGQFSVDQNAHTVKIGSSPVGKTVRAADLTSAGVISGTVALKGIGFRRFANPGFGNTGGDGFATLYFAGSAYNSTIENCWFEQIGFAAISSIRPITIRNVTVQDVGGTPIFLSTCDGSVVEKSIMRRYNRGRWNAEPILAGIKVTSCNGLTIRDNIVEDGPNAYGIWLDTNVTDYKITGNIVNGYTGLAVELANDMERGIEAEISGGGLFSGVQKFGIIAGNRVTGCEVGVMIFDCDSNLIYNNDLRGNDADLMFWQDSGVAGGARPNRNTYRSVAEVPWVTKNNSVCNNMLAVGGHTVAYACMIEAEHQQFVTSGATQFPDVCAGNWFDTSTGKIAALGKQGTSGRTGYTDLASLAAAVGSKLGANTESATRPDNSTATQIPALVAAALGVTTGATILGPPAPAPVAVAA